MNFNSFNSHPVVSAPLKLHTQSQVFLQQMLTDLVFCPVEMCILLCIYIMIQNIALGYYSQCSFKYQLVVWRSVKMGRSLVPLASPVLPLEMETLTQVELVTDGRCLGMCGFFLGCFSWGGVDGRWVGGGRGKKKFIFVYTESCIKFTLTEYKFFAFLLW